MDLRGALILCSALLTLGACADSDVESDSIAARADSVTSTLDHTIDPTRRPSEEPFVELAAEIPGFAGYYLDENGDIMVNVTDVDIQDAAEIAASYLRRSAGFLADELDRGDRAMRLVQVSRSFSELAAWRDQLFDTVFEIPEVSWLHIDIQENDVVIGVATEEARVQAVELVLDLGIPREAVRTEFTSAFFADATVTDTFSPVPGGVRVQVLHSPTITNCTAVPAANRCLQVGYFTNSHCTGTQMFPDSSAVYQAGVANNYIGAEQLDPAGFTGAGCPAGKTCRYSDAAFILKGGSVSPQWARIARPMCDTGCTVIDASNPTFTISGEGTPIINATVNMVGASSGWVFGQVTNTCHDAIDGTLVYKCQHRATYNRAGGDSGAPVFYTDPYGVYLAGVHRGYYTSGSTIYAVYSPISNVRADFGNIRTHGSFPIPKCQL